MRTTKLMLILLLLSTALFAATTHAQEDSHPLLNMLALVPDNETFRETWIRYQDFRAVEDAVPYLSQPPDTLTWLDNNPITVTSNRWTSAPDSIQFLFAGAEDIPTTMGFDFFDIDRTLSFGQPPEHGVIWQGEFNTQAIAAAHSARDYEATSTIGTYEWWCPVEGCDQGLRQDLRGRLLSNIFDTGLGRKIPFLMSDTLLISSPPLEVLENVQAVINGDETSLADADDYRTLVNAVLDPDHFSGLLVQLQFLPNADVQVIVDYDDPESLANMLPPGASPEAVQTLIDEQQRPAWAIEYGDLPLYYRMAFADRQEGDRQMAVVALLYDNPDDAAIAAAEVSKRLSLFSDAITRGGETEPLFDVYVEDANFDHHVYTDSATGLSVAVITIDYYTPNEEEAMRPMSSEEPAIILGRGFDLLARAIFRRTLYPLWVIDFPDGE